MRLRFLVFLTLLGLATAAPAQVSIGINFSLFPDLVRVPDYPVYYAPRLGANYFFYDGLYWVFQDDEWYSSDWYNGPWYRVAPAYVPLYVLRIPVRYYRHPPPYFHGWRRDAPPRWGEHWGRDWEHQRAGWDRWDRRAAPAPAPLPTYQRQYSGNRYPRPEERHAIQDQRYRYQPRDTLVREHVRSEVRGPAATSAQERPPEARKDAGKDARNRDQRPASAAPPAPKAEAPAPHQSAPATREMTQEPRKDSGRDARDRDQRPPTQPATTREPPAPRAAAQPQQPQAARPHEPTARPQPHATPNRESSQRAAASLPPPPPLRPAAPPPPAPHAAAPPAPAPKPAAAPPNPQHEKGADKKGD